MEPVPTIYSTAQMKTLCPQPSRVTRKPPKPRSILPDQLQEFHQVDQIKSLENLDETHAPPGLRTNALGIITCASKNLPKLFRTIRVDKLLRVSLERDGVCVPLPKWWSSKARLVCMSTLENLPSYLDSLEEFDGAAWDILEELCNLKYVKPKGRSYSAKLICQSLLLRYTSLQAYLFFDNVHLVKNIRNNLLAAKKFTFPPHPYCVK